MPGQAGRNGQGKVVSVVDLMFYTATGQLQSETTQFGPFGKSVAYSYYDNGDLKHYTDPEGRTLEYHYDANRQLEAINLPNVGLYTVNSYRWFAPEQVSLPGGSVQKRSYDGFMQLTGIEVKDPGQNRKMHYQYQYDKVGNITGKATEHGAYVYQYDDLYRLIEAQNPNSATETFTYDPVGNRLTTQASPTPWIYNANHALQSRPEAISYGYDANGSTTQITRNGQTTQLIYNAANRLAEIKDHANQSVATYRYDPFGRRISKTVHGDTTYFLYSPQGLIGEYSATGSLIRGYGYKPGGHWMTDPLYLKTGNAREQHYFYQNDHLGTPQKLMSTTGAIVWDARYEVFGQATPIPLLPGVQPIDNPLRFAGQYHDPETGWHYNWHRYYSPELGRYVTRDPIGLVGGWNSYVYADENPLRYLDPYGLISWQVKYGVVCAGETAALCRIDINLRSKECVNGRRAVVHLSGVMMELGLSVGIVQGFSASVDYVREPYDDVAGISALEDREFEISYGRLRQKFVGPVSLYGAGTFFYGFSQLSVNYRGLDDGWSAGLSTDLVGASMSGGTIESLNVSYLKCDDWTPPAYGYCSNGAYDPNADLFPDPQFTKPTRYDWGWEPLPPDSRSLL
jgi:RHS repeat-associated protein